MDEATQRALEHIEKIALQARTAEGATGRAPAVARGSTRPGHTPPGEERATAELIDETLKAVRGEDAQTRERLTAIEQQLVTINGYLATLVTSDLNRHTELAELRARIERIERRQELAEPSA